MTQIRKCARIGPLVPFAFVALFGCTDLAVTNLNAPDRSRALAEPGDVEALIAGTFGVFFNSVHNSTMEVNLFPNYATEMVGIPAQGGAWLQTREPRPPYDAAVDLPSSSGPWGPRFHWSSMNQIAASVHDGFRVIEGRGLTITVGGRDETPRALAFAKFMQGVAWGHLALLFDRVTVIPETEELESDAVEQAVQSIVPWQEALSFALASLEEAKNIAEQNSITFPPYSTSQLWFAAPQQVDSGALIRLANTMAARLLVLSARTPQDRAQVDWAKVLEYTAGGVTKDLEVVLAPGFRSSLLYARAQSNSVGCTCFRLDPRLIGQADVSGAYQEWISSPVDSRERFDIVTPDRRITGTSPKSDGAYARYRADDNGFAAGLGLYFRSGYQWARHAHRGFEANTGTARMLTVDENTLLRAEALLRTGSRAEAANLINVTRTRSHTLPTGVTYPGLPAVTQDGVPLSDDCVPRTDAGACGDLMVALRYERMLELAGLDAIRGYHDSRGFGLLPDGSWLQQPIPSNELQLLGLPIYTYGGAGGEWAAVYGPATLP